MACRRARTRAVSSQHEEACRALRAALKLEPSNRDYATALAASQRAAGVAAAAVRQALRRACSCKNPDSLCDALPGGGKAKGKKEKIKTADELDAELESYQKAAAAKAAKACRCYATPSAPMPLFAHALLPRQGVKPDAAKLDADMEAYMSAKPAATAKVAAAPAATDAAAAALAQAAL